MDWIWREEKKNVKYIKPEYPFEIRGYFDKLEFKESRTSLLKSNELDKYIGFSNNACESINSYIRSLIPINQKISLNFFVKIIQKLFLKFEYKGTRNEINQEHHIIIKRLFTDNLLDIINLDFNNKYIDNKQFNHLKHVYDEKILFSLKDEDGTEENKIDNVINVSDSEEK